MVATFESTLVNVIVNFDVNDITMVIAMVMSMSMAMVVTCHHSLSTQHGIGIWSAIVCVMEIYILFMEN